ncbi:allophanate hydrolase [Clostridium tyrobutyricum]|uniref:Allophanate hydrolase n=1 Tax=Clostridium tyrobutyricum DIVETGP TaxID=1408889 RepID=W6N8Y6_CLOTY|nr:allophanate hydrolase [Clostridium tyrobutyricum]AND85343.1 allophanate hydrolase [Clostridium tyrobutyricum]ANP69894.1 allophanate hydrolase [Clostridium tyrobutyricum]MBV4429213.1 allophanate hydrolase [Clostridium tyrobutyricum]MBV4434281.1 allophanate hydrolase [Clostridium tyrobutyricum]MBV4444344.1 allophanate hydrolase [Clostridium tyrobutyricum]
MIDGKLTISYLKRGYKKGIFTPENICYEIIKRANETADMNIWIVPPSMEFIQQYLDNLKTLNKEKALLWGIPFAIKDNIDIKGIYTTAGCRNFAYMPREHATVVKLLIKEGAIPVGKTNLDQFATGLVGTRSLFGETHNSLKPELISGGSSSGSAVSVAMGQAVFSLGTDTAGSGRVPAALNNLVGLKPSLGGWSTKGVVPACASLDCITVFTHNLEDAKLVNKIAWHYDKQCCWSKKLNWVKEKMPEKICLPDSELEFYGDYAEQYKYNWKMFVKTVEKMDIPIEYVDYKIFAEAAAILYDGPWIAERWSDLGGFVVKNESHEMVPVTESILKSGNKDTLKADSVFKAMHRLAKIKCEVRKILKDSILLLPTCGGTYTRKQVDADPIETNSNMGLYTNHCNLLELSALAFQAGFIEEKIPFGVTSFALSEEDGINLAFAKVWQSVYLEDRMIPLAVCGLHMRGLSLETQLINIGAKFKSERKTSSNYRLIKLPTNPSKPGLIRVGNNGQKIQLEIWDVPIKQLGEFLEKIPEPLCIGKVELDDGRRVSGFICESYMQSQSEDISKFKSWRNINK